jgi:hypothetical protein
VSPSASDASSVDRSDEICEVVLVRILEYQDVIFAGTVTVQKDETRYVVSGVFVQV